MELSDFFADNPQAALAFSGGVDSSFLLYAGMRWGKRVKAYYVRTRVASNKSPWLSLTNVGDIYNVPISHGEGKFLASRELVAKLSANGQIATQYVDLLGNPTMDAAFNPNGSVCAIEGITSPDGRVFGKMGHSERIGKNLYRNVPGQYDIQLFENAVKYFK